MNSLKNKIIIKWSHLKNKPWHEIIDVWFNKFAILEQDDESKKEISLRITEGINTQKLYWFEIILSALIAAFGLLQNSVAVIIGAMLIAPLMRPIQAMAFGVSLGRTSLFWKASKLLIISTFLAILMGYIVNTGSPFQLETKEIIARTNPNLFDLFIAALSAMVAFLAVAYKRLIESVAGVAMAASLAPPLAVTGIEISLGFWDKAWGSFLLFVTNLVAIILVGSIMFVLYGFNPHQENTAKTIKKFGVLVLITILLWVPLFSSLKTIGQQQSIKTISKEELSKELATIDATLNQITITEYSKKNVLLHGEIRVPENIDIKDKFLHKSIEAIDDQFPQAIEVTMDVIRTTTLGK